MNETEMVSESKREREREREREIETEGGGLWGNAQLTCETHLRCGLT